MKTKFLPEERCNLQTIKSFFSRMCVLQKNGKIKDHEHKLNSCESEGEAAKLDEKENETAEIVVRRSQRIRTRLIEIEVNVLNDEICFKNSLKFIFI